MGDIAKRITGLNKQTDVTMKRGAVASMRPKPLAKKSPEKQMPPPVPEPKIPKK